MTKYYKKPVSVEAIEYKGISRGFDETVEWLTTHGYTFYQLDADVIRQFLEDYDTTDLPNKFFCYYSENDCLVIVSIFDVMIVDPYTWLIFDNFYQLTGLSDADFLKVYEKKSDD